MYSEIDQVHLHFGQDNVWLLNICLGIIMFGVALELRLSHFRDLLRAPKSALVAWASQLLLVPLLTLALLYVLHPVPSVALGMILVVCCPSGSVSNFLSLTARGNAALAVSLSTTFALFAPLTLPLMFSFWVSGYAPAATLSKTVSVGAVDMFRTVFLLLGLPLALGMTLSARLPQFAVRLSKPLRWISLLILLAFIGVSLVGNWQHFVPHAPFLVGIVALHNALALLGGYLFAQLFSLPEPDARTICLESGIHNTGLSLALVFSFFDGLGGMAMIAAWWGIWDMISGMALAHFWAKKTPAA